MCFSPVASFGSSVVLAAIGVASISKVQSRRQIVFASIPLLFSVQQAAEGVLWLVIPNPHFAGIQYFATYFFLFFAQIVWPVWVPFAIFDLEDNAGRKKILKFFIAIGVTEALYQTHCLWSYHIYSAIVGSHISYQMNHPATFKNLSGVCYVLATILPPFFSSIKKMWAVGALILVSCIITAILYTDYVVSVWCFFASIISISVLAIMHQMGVSKNNTVQIN